MRRIIILVLLIVFCLYFGKGLVACAVQGYSDEVAGKSRYNFLIVGFDDAYENTDAIILASFNTSKNEASFVQIPRDTYVYYGGRDMKINGVYPSIKVDKKDEYAALCELSSLLSSALGFESDGFVGVSTNAFSRLVDHIGGVDITFPSDFIYKDESGDVDIDIKKGTHHFSGKEALSFVRYRRGYALGDLGRIDAQKLFLSAFITKLKGSINPSVVLKMMCDSGEGFVSNIRVADLFGIVLRKNGRLVDAKIMYANLPGQALTSENTSYFIANKRASGELFNALGYGITDFDCDKSFMPRENKNFLDIYNSNSINFRIYDDSDLTRILIPSG